MSSGGATEAPRIAVVMPRGMSFGPERASSIDLCAHDFIAHSRYRASTTVFADAVPQPYAGLAVDLIPGRIARAHLTRLLWLWRRLRRARPDIVVVHQHLPSAAWLARLLPETPVLLHAHNFLKAKAGRAHRARLRQMQRLACTICVSDAVCGKLHDDYPEITATATVHNGLDIGVWQPAETRENTVLLVARVAPAKGVREAVTAMQEVLARFPGWQGLVILSERQAEQAFSAEIEALVARTPDCIALHWQRPFAEIKHANESAAIALVPSVWAEPYGRTALEAHAGGAALISSGTGGLREISGEAALFVPQVDVPGLASAIETLIGDDTARARLATAGLERARQFDLATVSGRLDAVYDDVLAQRKA
jgi:glycosyltransferase involved in cell wall biosynthesis